MNKTLQAKKLIDKHITRQRMAKQFRLPPERTLAEQFGYSRATIGKALGVLEGEGIISRKKGSGTFIRKHDYEKHITIALVMRTAYHYTDMHFRLIVEEVSKYAEENNIDIQIFDHLTDMFKADPDNNSLMRAIKNGAVDGVLIASRIPLGILSKTSAVCPAVSINNVFGDGSEIPCISCDYFRVGFLAGKYLLEKGHRKVAYVTENLEHPESVFDFSGFKAAFEMAGVDITEHDILETKQDMNTFKRRIAEFFTNASYTACFVRCTSYASRIIPIFKNNGIKIPDDLSIIAAGNYHNSQSGIKLTVVDNQLAEMCILGLQTVQNLIEKNNKIKGGLKLLSPQIIENNSVSNINFK